MGIIHAWLESKKTDKRPLDEAKNGQVSKVRTSRDVKSENYFQRRSFPIKIKTLNGGHHLKFHWKTAGIINYTIIINAWFKW